MTATIDPADFTRLMALPATDRHDLLEFLGSTLAGRVGTAEVLRRATMTAAGIGSPQHDLPQHPAGRRAEAH
jgi:hypothetical protein